MNTKKSRHPYHHRRGITPFRRKLLCLIALFFFSSNLAFANPYGPQVINGNVSFNTQGNKLTITNSPNSIINWQGFSIGINELTRFIQQSGNSAVLNRVIGQDPSAILGALQSNGRVFLINPNGILFGQGARIDVNGLIASTLNLSNQDFLAGKYNFMAGIKAGSIENQGTITTPMGGQVYLIAPDIKNSGIINSPKGDVILAAGHSVQLVDSANPYIAVTVSAPENSVVNLGKIIADSGRIGIYGGLISQKGIIKADSAVAGENGQILFKATRDVTLDSGSVTSAQGGGTIKIMGGMDSGTVTVNGALDASAPSGGDGGFIETSAAHVKVDDSARITTLAPYGKTGKWLIDPQDYTIGSGGDITGAALSSSLGTTGVEILSSGGGTAGSGDINVNDAVSWSANTLTLTAARDININEVMSASGTSALVMNTATTNGSDDGVAGGTVKVGFNPDGSFKGRIDFPGRSGTGFLTINGNGYTVINDLGVAGSITGTDLQGMNGNLAGYYALGANIDANGTSGWNGGDGFSPVGIESSKFTGAFDGLGHTITDLYINRPATVNVGLFGGSSGNVQNVGLVNVNITGKYHVGGLVGLQQADGGNSTISNSYVTGAVSSPTGGPVGEVGGEVGGLVGRSEATAGGSATITNSSSSADVSGLNRIGGLVGVQFSNDDGINAIENSHSTGAVTGNWSNDDAGIGGLAGFQEGWNGGTSTISNSHHSVGLVKNLASGNTGGLVGFQSANSGTPTITNSYNTAAVTGGNRVGGLVGYNGGGTITNSYNTGTVSGTGSVGGLVGYNSGGTIEYSYSTGGVSGTTNVGGLVGYNAGTGNINNTYSTGAVSGTTNVGGLVGYNDANGTISNSFWDTTTSGVDVGNGIGWDASAGTPGPSDNGVTGMASSDMMKQATFEDSGWSFDTDWWMSEDNTHPFLRSEYSTNITNAHQLQLMELDHNASYTLANNIDLGQEFAAVSGNYPGMWGAAGFVPVADNSYFGFNGVFDGFGHTISGLSINRPDASNVGLFGYTNSSAIIRNVGLVNGNITGNSIVGGLVGYNNGSISNSYNTGTVTGNSSVGGLAGYNYGSISNSYNTGTVTEIGGDVPAPSAGGLVGDNYGTVTNSYNTGVVTGINYVGGLVGYNDGAIENSYSSGPVSGTTNVGGLVGYNDVSGTINHTYSSGAVSGTTNVGGLVGDDNGTISNSFWDTETSGRSTSAGGTGKSTSEMMTQTTFTDSGWDFTSIWGIKDTVSYPYLKWQFSGAPQIISGFLDVDEPVGGKAIKIAGNGTALGNSYTGANGFYYFAIPASSVGSGDALLTYVSGDATKGASVHHAASGDMTGTSLYSNTLFAKSLSGGTMSNTTLADAKGSLDDADIPYGVVSNNLTVDSLAFETASGTTYNLNGNITSGSTQTYNGPLTLSTDAILTSDSGDIFIGGDVSYTGADPRSLTFKAAGTIDLHASKTITSSNAPLNVTFNANRGGEGGAIVMNSGSGITSNGGNITLSGGVDAFDNPLPAVGTSLNPDGVSISFLATLDAGAGNIFITGKGYDNPEGVGGHGVNISGATLTTTSGNISITGTGGSGTSGSGGAGVNIKTESGDVPVASLIQTSGGTINITGYGGDGMGESVAGGYGVYIDGSIVQTDTGTVGTDSITITGTGGAGGNSDYGYGGYGGDGVYVLNSDINTVGGGNIYIYGEGGKGGDTAGYSAYGGDGGYGVIINGSIVQTNGTNSITIEGYGGDGSAGTDGGYGGYGGDGVNVTSASLIQTSEGDISISGYGGKGGNGSSGVDGNSNEVGNGGWGVYADASTINTLGSGNIDVYGEGGQGGDATDMGAPASRGGYGVIIEGESTVQTNTETAGTGSLTITGIGGVGGSNEYGYGGYGGDGVNVTSASLIRTSGGAINITGYGGDGGNGISGFDYDGNEVGNGGRGVYADASMITTVDGGTITIEGTGGTGGAASDMYAQASGGGYGVYAYNSTITTENGGNITIDGTGGLGGAASGTDGTGGDGGHGVVIDGTTVQTGGTGNITITGSGGASGLGDYDGYRGYGLQLGEELDGYLSAASGNITLTTDTIMIYGDSYIEAQDANSTLWIKPYTSGTLIDLGVDTYQGALVIDSTALDAMTAGTIKIGDSNAGNITIAGPIEPANASTLSLQTGGEIENLPPEVESPGNTITVENLALRAVGDINLTAANYVTTLAASSTSGSIIFNNTGNTGTLTVGTVDGLGGVSSSSGGSVTLNAAGNINQSGSGAITAGTLNLTNTYGATDLSLANNAISYLGTIDATGQSFSLNNTTALAQTGTITASELNLTNTGGINLSGNNNVPTVHLTNSTSGNINYNSSVGSYYTLNIDGSNATPGGSFTVTESTGNLSVGGGEGSGNITTQGGDVSLTASRVDGVLTTTGNIGTGAGGNITLTADNMALSGSLNAVSGSGKVVTLQPNAANTTVQVGAGAVDASGQLGLTDVELQTVTADTLRVGKSKSGVMTVTGGATLTSAPTLNLISGGGISGSGNTITVSNLALSGGAGAINVTTAASTLAAQNTSGGITISNTQSTGLSVGAVDGVSGISSNGGAISLTETAGDITIANTVNAGAGNVTMKAAGALVNGVTSSDKNVIGNSLNATAGNGIGHQKAMKTEVANLGAENTGGSRNIEFNNNGALTITDGIKNSGSGNIVLDNTGAIDTGSQKIQASQGAVTVTAHSPLTIGSGGLAADGDVTLEAAQSGGDDTLTINGPVRSNNGNVNLVAGSSIIENVAVEAPNGHVSRTVHGELVSTSDTSVSLTTEMDLAVVQSENTFTTALNNTYITTVEGDNARTAPPPDKKEDEDKDSDKKGSTSQSEETSKAKLPYCN